MPEGQECNGAGSSPMRSSAEAAAAYQAVQRRVDARLRGRIGLCDLPVPACPQWSVRQTVSHLAGTAQDIAALNLEGAGTEAWTQNQVARLAQHELTDLLDLWAETTETVVNLLANSPDLVASQAVFDALSHEHDICGAISEPGERIADPAFGVAAGFFATTLDRRLRRSRAVALELTTPTTGTLQLGDTEATPERISVALSDFEALRTFAGRRSATQIVALPWQGDPAPILRVFDQSVVRPPLVDLIE